MPGSIPLLLALAVAQPFAESARPTDTATGQSPEMLIERSATDIRLRGNVSSTAHEVILRQTLREFFPELNSDVDVAIGQGLPAGWSLVTDLVLRTLADTEAASATIRPEQIFIRGVTMNREGLAASLASIDASLLPGMTLVSDVIEIRPVRPFDDMCRARFEQAVTGRRIDFAGSGAELSPGAQPLLDALVEIAVDCPQSRIRVTGHTDASGNEGSNVALSLWRAESVVDYMRNRGLPAERLEAVGAGSAQPLVDGSDPQSRRANRRVEFELLLP